MRTISLLAHLLLLKLFLACGAVESQAKRVALVIGNSAYKHAAQLANPKNDAVDIAAALKQVGFEVVKGFDLDRAGMHQVIRKFARALKQAKAGVFYYAGHGIQVEGKNYLVPTDAMLEDATGIDFELIQVGLVQRTMERTSKSNILFLDACRNNPLARNLARAMGTRSASIARGLAPIESGVGTLISFSTQPGNIALDGTGRNSPYAASLAQHLTMPGQDISSLLIKVRNDVIRATNHRQVPWEHTALTDQFFFSSKARVNSSPTRAKRAEMAALNSSLGTRNDRSPELDEEQLRVLRGELERVGCWLPGSDDPIERLRQSLQGYNAFRNAKLRLDGTNPELAITAIRQIGKKVCPSRAFYGTCLGGNIDICRYGCDRGNNRACARLKKLKRTKRGVRAGTCVTGNVDHCSFGCSKGHRLGCARLAFLKRLMKQRN